MTEAHEGTRGNEATMWDDEAMHAAYKEAFDKDPDAHHWALLSWIRDDMQQALAAGAAEHAAALAELKAQLAERSECPAQEWIPVADGQYAGLAPVSVERLVLQVESDGKEISQIYADIPAGINTIYLSENIRLCRRVQREDDSNE